MINLPSFHPFFVLKLEVRALSQNVCKGIYGLVALKIFSGEGAPRHPYDFLAFSAQSRTNYFKLATPLRSLTHWSCDANATSLSSLISLEIFVQQNIVIHHGKIYLSYKISKLLNRYNLNNINSHRHFPCSKQN